MNKFRIICKLAKCGNIFAKLYEYFCRPLCWGPSLCWAGWPLAGSVSGSGSSPWPALMHCKYFKCYRSTSTFPTVRIRIRLKNFFYSKKEIHEWKFLLRNKTDLIRQNVLLTNFFVFDGHSYKSKFNKLLTNHNQNWGTFSVKKNPKNQFMNHNNHNLEPALSPVHCLKNLIIKLLLELNHLIIVIY